MEYAVLIYQRPGIEEGLTDEERREMTEEYLAVRKDPRCLGGAALQSVDTATTIRKQGAETLITDGPYANTKEVFGGYYLFEADNLDDVLSVAKSLPALRLGGAVEVRPLRVIPS